MREIGTRKIIGLSSQNVVTSALRELASIVSKIGPNGTLLCQPRVEQVERSETPRNPGNTEYTITAPQRGANTTESTKRRATCRNRWRKFMCIWFTAPKNVSLGCDTKIFGNNCARTKQRSCEIPLILPQRLSTASKTTFTYFVCCLESLQSKTS